MAIEVQSADIIRVIIQFLNENGLNETARVLQKESGVGLNYIEDRADFAAKMDHGRWDRILEQISLLELSETLLTEVYEQIFIEMLEMNELEAARAILRQSAPLKNLKESNIDGYLKLENLLSQCVLSGEFPSQLKDSKMTRRNRLLHLIFENVQNVPRARLMTIINSALKWEEHCGKMSSNSSYDLLLGQIPSETNLPVAFDKLPTNCFKKVNLPTGSHAECIGFSPDGEFCVVGTADGFLEVWDPIEGTLRTDLPFQTGENDLMRTKSAICCISFSHDSEMLACGTIEGDVCVWKLSTGKLIKSFPTVHKDGVTSISFSPDLQSILTTGFDNNLNILGMKSGRILKELHGHTSYVNCAMWLDNSTVISGGHDGSLKMWNLPRNECIATSTPNSGKSLFPAPIRSICEFLITENDVIFLVTTQSMHLHLYSSMKREFIQVIPSKIKDPKIHILNSLVRKNIFYYITSDGHIYSSKVEDLSSSAGSAKICAAEPIGFTLHPKFNILISFDVTGEVKFWKS